MNEKEKAIAYDKALEREKKLQENSNGMILNKWLIGVFPDLGESEDERIRKGIIDFLWKEKIFLQEVHKSVENSPKYRFVMDAIAWLEKQKDTNVLIQEASEKAYTEGMRVERKHWLEKQGASIDVDSILNKVGINPAYKDGNAWCILYGDNIQDGFCGFGHTKEEALVEFLKDLLERQGEQPADKPKFKVGDWVVWDNKISCHVDNIYQGKESLMYTITDTNNMTRNYSVKGFDNNVHLWTIQDTKDGDVLAEDSCIFIIKKLNQNLSAKVYCCLHDDGDFEINSTLGFDNTSTYPATKEQRVILFQKMKETGYEWDDESKELKKIDQKPTYMIKPKFKVGDWIVKNDTTNKPVQIVSYEERTDTTLVWFSNGTGTDIDFLCGYHLWTIQDSEDGDVLYSPTHHLVWIYKDDKHYYVCVNLNYTSNNVSVDGSISVPNDVCPATTDERTILFAKMKEAGYEWDTEEKELRKIEQKPAWSEEDERVLKAIINTVLIYRNSCEEDDEVKDRYDDELNWLKSIKNRVQLQPKIEWSEEDEDNLRFSERHFKTLLTNTYYDTFCNWLKSVKERLGGK